MPKFYAARKCDLGGPEGERWIVTGPGFDWRNGPAVSGLSPFPGNNPPMSEQVAITVAGLLDDAYRRGQLDKQKEIRLALGFSA